MKARTFEQYFSKLKVGDRVLFQEYADGNISKPIYAIYLGMDVYDMACVMRYIRVPKEWCPYDKIAVVEEHIDWMDHINILGHWKRKPLFKSLIKAYRKSVPALSNS